jgi:6-phosphogluconolactonase
MAPYTNAPKIIVEPTAETAVQFVATLFKAIICEADGRGGACRLALAGGTTPRALYQRLASESVSGQVPWSCVDVFFGDERDVPLDHVESNYGMAQRTLLDHVPIDPTRIHPMRADAEDIASAAAEYERTIRENVPSGPDGVPCFDLILLGMGGDGHAASLFPGNDAVEENRKLVLAYYVPVLGRKRMTITFPLINAARNIILLVTGADKAPAVQNLLGEESGDRHALPAARVNPSRGLLTLVLDADAGRLAGLKAV